MGPNPVLRSISAFYAMTVYNISFIRDEGRKDEHSLSILTIRLHNLAILLFCFCFAFPPPRNILEAEESEFEPLQNVGETASYILQLCNL